jgi:hypothetical protein
MASFVDLRKETRFQFLVKLQGEQIPTLSLADLKPLGKKLIV